LIGTDSLEGKEAVWITEGELDRLLLLQYLPSTHTAVTSTAGANSFQNDWANLIKSRYVIIIYDNDEAGQKGVTKIKSLIPRAIPLTLPLWVGDKGDLTDYFTKGGTYKDLWNLVKNARRNRTK
jgi:hypothetical protein